MSYSEKIIFEEYNSSHQFLEKIIKRSPLLILIIVLILSYGEALPWLVLSLLLLPVLIFLFYKNNLDFVLIIYIISVGVFHRILSLPHLGDFSKGSDVLSVISEAADAVLLGLNPYQINYLSVASSPSDHALVYPPFSFLFYLPFKLIFGNILIAEIISFSLVVFLILILASLTSYSKILIPVAVYSLSYLFFAFTLNGSNDTSASFLIFSAFCLIFFYQFKKKIFLIYLSAVFISASIAFKQYLAVPAVFLIYYVYKNVQKGLFYRFFSLVVLFTVFIVLPFLLLSPSDFISDILRPAQPPHLDGWNLYAIFQVFDINVSRQIYPVLSLIDLIATASITMFIIKKFKPKTVLGLSVFIPLVFFVSIFLAPFASSSYIAAIMPFLIILPIAADLDNLLRKTN